MNFEIPIPRQLFLRKRYGLLVGDDRVDVISWFRGTIDLLQTYTNDQVGSTEFRNYLNSNRGMFQGRAFHLLLNIVGEDYRYELTPHLYGQYKTNFLNKRKDTLYRGATYTQVVTLGREELGKRQDMTLFLGVLTEDKVGPWVKALQRHDIEIAGIFSQALALHPIVKKFNLGSKYAVVTIFSGGGSIRQCYFHAGQMRHSRVTKLPPSGDPTLVMKAIASETDRFQHYLVQLKTSRGVRVEYHVIVPPGELKNFQKTFKEIAGEKSDRYFFYDGEQVARVMGIRRPLVEWGRDSSLAIDSMFTTLRFKSLAPLNLVRFYWIKLVSTVTVGAAALYAAYAIGGEGLSASRTYFQYYTANQALQSEVAQLRSSYNAQVAAFGEAPSTPENMRAVSNIFTYSSYAQINPAPLLYYVSKAMQDNATMVELESIEWFLTDEQGSLDAKPLAYLSGNELYQVVALRGRFFERSGESLSEVLANVQRFVAGFEEREDVEVTLVRGPKALQSDDQVSGSATSGAKVVRASELTDLNFEIHVSWRQRTQEFVNRILEAEEQV